MRQYKNEQLSAITPERLGSFGRAIHALPMIGLLMAAIGLSVSLKVAASTSWRGWSDTGFLYALGIGAISFKVGLSSLLKSWDNVGFTSRLVFVMVILAMAITTQPYTMIAAFLTPVRAPIKTINQQHQQSSAAVEDTTKAKARAELPAVAVGERHKGIEVPLDNLATENLELETANKIADEIKQQLVPISPETMRIIGVKYTGLAHDKHRFMIKVLADTNKTIALFMKNMESAYPASELNLRTIRKNTSTVYAEIVVAKEGF